MLLSEKEKTGFFEKLKKIYYSIEDRYYDFLDSVNEHIPVYKVIDPIDKYVPSMIIILLLLLLPFFFVVVSFFIPFISGIISPPPPPVKLSEAIIRVEDSEGNPLEEALVLVEINGRKLEKKTDKQGVITISFRGENTSANIAAEKTGFKSKTLTLLLSDGKATTVVLEKIVLPPVGTLQGPINITVLNGLTNTVIDDREIRIGFSCEAGIPPEERIIPPKSKQPITITGDEVKNCQNLKGHFFASGYNALTMNLFRTNTSVLLQPVSVDKNVFYGSLKVIVFNNDGSTVEGASIFLTNTVNGTEFPEKITGASGTALFESLVSGNYTVSVTSVDGRHVSQEVSIGKGEALIKKLTLPELETGKKLFVKLVDDENNEPLSGVIAVFRVDSLLFKEATSNEEGEISIPINASDEGRTFTVLPILEGYTVKIFTITPKDETETVPETLRIKKIGEDIIIPPESKGSLKVRVIKHNGESAANTIIRIFTSSNILRGESRTDSSGEALFEGITPGQYSVKVIYAPVASRLLTLEKGNVIVKPDTETSVVLQLPEENFVEKKLFFKVVDSDGLPVVGMTVQLFVNGQFADSFLTDEQGIGEKQIDASNAGEEFVASLSKAGFVPTRAELVLMNASVSEPQIIEVERSAMPPEKGALKVVVKDSTGNPVENSNVAVYDSFKFLVDTGTTNANGSVLFQDILVGSYTVVAIKDAFRKEFPGVQITAGQTQEIELQFAEQQTNEFKLFLRVLQAVNDEPIQNAEVRIKVNGFAFALEATDSKGELELLIGSTDSQKEFTAEVSKEGFVTNVFGLNVKPVSGLEPDILRLNKKSQPAKDYGALEVTVLDNSQPASSVKVTVVSQESLVAGTENTDSSGKAFFSELLPGKYTVIAFKEETNASRFADITIESGTTSTLVMELPTENLDAKKLSFKVVDKNSLEPLTNALALIFVDGVPFVVQPFAADGQGSFVVPVNLENAGKDFTASISAPNHISRQVNLEVFDKDSDSMQTFELERIPLPPDECTDECGKVRVVVKDGSGNLVENALVLLYSQGFDSPLFVTPTETDSSGTVLFEEIGIGSYYARAFKGSLKGESSAKQLLGNQTIELTVTLESEPVVVPGKGSIEASVFDSQSLPVQNAVVSVLNSDNIVLQEKNSSAEGKALFEELPVGVYNVSARFNSVQGNEFEVKKRVLVEKDKITRVILSFPPTTISAKKLFLKVVDSSSQTPLGGVTVKIFADGAKFAEGTTSSEGIFSVEVMDKDKARSFEAFLEFSGYTSDSFKLSVKDVSDTEPDLLGLQKIVGPDPGKGLLEVTVKRGSELIEGALVRVFDKFNILKGEQNTNVQGKTTFQNLRADTLYSVIAVLSDGTASIKKNIVVNADQINRVEIELPQTDLTRKKLFFKVLDKNSLEPVQNASIRILLNGLVWKKLSTDQTGVIDVSVNKADEQKSFSVWVGHEDYLAEQFALTVHDSDVAGPDEILLEKKPVSDCTTECGNVRVVVEDDSGQKITGAEIWLFRATALGPVFETSSVSGSQGEALFEKIRKGTFYAVASKDNLLARSASDQLQGGKTLVLRVVLSTKAVPGNETGSFKVRVVKLVNNQEESVENASVSIFKEGFSAPFNEVPVKTNAGGIALFENLPLARFYAVAIKESNNVVLRGESFLVKVVAGTQVEAKIVLEEKKTDCLNGCGNIRVRVVSSDNQPVSNAQVQLIEKSSGEVFDGAKLTDSQGLALFEDLPLKEFKAIAKKDLLSSESVYRAVVEGSTINLEVVLTQPSCKAIGKCGDVLVKVLQLEQGNLVPVSGAEVFLFDDTTNVQLNLNPKFSDNSGEALFEDLAFGEYSAKVLFGLKTGSASGKLDSTETLVLSVTIKEEANLCNGGECGNLTVLVKNELGQPVQGAIISLYKFVDSLKIPVNYLPGETILSDEQGRFKFENLDLGEYSVTASKDNLVAESDKVTLDAGKTKTVELTLLAGSSSIKATIFDNETLEPLEGAKLEVFDAETNDLIASCNQSNSDGECVIPVLVAGKQVYVRASRNGYFPQTKGEAGGNIFLNVGETIVLEFKLDPLPVPGDKLDIKFVKFCNEFNCENEVTKIVSLPDKPTIYYAKFELTLKEEIDSAIVQLIAGPESETSLKAQNYKIKLKQAKTVAFKSIEAATCLNNEDPWSIKFDCATASDSGAKIIQVNYENLKNGSYEVTVKFLVQQGLKEGETLELNYRAKAVFASETKETSMRKKQIIVGSNSSCSQDQSISYTFSLGLPGEQPDKLEVSNSFKKALKVSTNYALYYEIFNCSDSTINNAGLVIENKNPSGIISFPDLSGGQPITLFENAVLPGGSTTKIGSPINIKTEKLADFTEIEFVLLSSGQPVKGGTVKLNFSVVADKDLLIEGLPSDLFNSQLLKFDGVVKDPATNQPLEGVSFEVWLNGVLVGSGTTNKTGRIVFDPENQIVLKEGDKVELKVFKSGFAPKTFEFEVKPEIGLPPIEYSCVTVSPEQQNVLIGEETSLTVKTENCNQKVFLELSSVLPLSSGSFELSDNSSKTVTVTASKERAVVGVNQVLVKARLEKDSLLRPLKQLKIVVEDPNSCFSLDKYSFDLTNSSDSGKIINKCFFANFDPGMPEINISTFMVLLNPELVLPEELTFDLSIITKGKEVYTSSPKEISIFSVKDRPVTIKPKQSLRTALQDFNPFNPKDYIEGNPGKGVTGLKQAPTYSGGLFDSVAFIPATSNSKVEVWIQGNQVWAKYVGDKKTIGEYFFTLTNKSLAGEQQAVISVTDYVNKG